MRPLEAIAATALLGLRVPDGEDYGERMRFIFTFLRAYQQDPDLFTLRPRAPTG